MQSRRSKAQELKQTVSYLGHVNKPTLKLIKSLVKWCLNNALNTTRIIFGFIKFREYRPALPQSISLYLLRCKAKYCNIFHSQKGVYSQHWPLFEQCVTYFMPLFCCQVNKFVVFNMATKRRFFSYCNSSSYSETDDTENVC